MPTTKKQEENPKINLKDPKVLGNLMLELLDDLESLTTHHIRVRKQFEKKLKAFEARLVELEGRGR